MMLLASFRGPRPGRAGRWRALVLVAFAACACAFLIFAGSARGATRTWNGGGATNNWSDAGNWVGGLIPGASDVATFDGTSAKNVVINASVSVLGIDIGAAYTGTISQPAGSIVTVGATGFSESGGTFSGGTNAININGPFTLGGGVFTATSGTLAIRGNFTHTGGGTFNAATGTVATTLAATIDVSSSETFNNLTLTSGTKTIAAGDTLTATGATTLTAGALNGAGGTLAAQGSISLAVGLRRRDGHPADQRRRRADADRLDDERRRQPARARHRQAVGHVDPGRHRRALSGPTNDWTYLAGSIDPGTSTVVFAGTQTISGSHALHDVVFRRALTHTVAAGRPLTVGGTLTLTDGRSRPAPSPRRATSARPRLRRRQRHPAHRRRRRPGLHGRAPLTTGTLPLLVIDKPAGTLPGGHHPDDQRLDLPRGHARPGHRARSCSRAQRSAAATLFDVAFRATTTIAAGDTLTATGARPSRPARSTAPAAPSPPRGRSASRRASTAGRPPCSSTAPARRR